MYALREEGDLIRIQRAAPQKRILSTPSARRATAAGSKGGHGHCISIHALREEGDPKISCRSISPNYFYPRPPRGGRPCFGCSQCGYLPYFYPRPPRGGRLYDVRNALKLRQISIHALREEGDNPPDKPLTFIPEFLSTPSARRATTPAQTLSRVRSDFYPRPP